MGNKKDKQTKTFTEEIEVMGSQLVQQVKDLLNEGNVRQLRIKASDGDVMLETPLTFGVVAGGAVALAAPWLAILGAIAAFVTHVRLEIVRDVPVDETGAAKAKGKRASAKAPGPDTAATAKPSTKAKSAAKRKSASKPKTGATVGNKAKTTPKPKAKPRKKAAATKQG